MTLGTDVSGLTTTAATAAAQGLSIVVPLYNEAAGLAVLHERLGGLARTLRQSYGLDCEVVYVDDGSTDSTLAIARGLAADALDVQVVSLSRNFGKEAALMAGLDHARRGAVLFMDGDGQHPPALIEKLVGYWIDEGYDVVYTAKAHRDNESFMRRQAVHGFYALINWAAGQKIPEDAGDFRLLSPRAAAALRLLPERNRFFKRLASWIGFRQIRVDYEPAPRAHGVTTFSPGRLVRRRRAPLSGPPPNERRCAAPHLAMRRRLRAGRWHQPRHPRFDRARPPQRHLGDGGRRSDWPRRGRRVAGRSSEQPALRDRAARDAHRAVSSADDALSAAQWWSVPAISGHAAIGPAAAARSGIDRRRTFGPARGVQGAVRPRARFCRRPPACATVSAGARRL